MEFIEDEILESEEFDERYGGGGNGGGTGGYRAMKTMTMMRTTMSAEVYLVLVDMVVVDTVEDAATNN